MYKQRCDSRTNTSYDSHFLFGGRTPFSFVVFCWSCYRNAVCATRGDTQFSGAPPTATRHAGGGGFQRTVGWRRPASFDLASSPQDGTRGRQASRTTRPWKPVSYSTELVAKSLALEAWGDWRQQRSTLAFVKGHQKWTLALVESGLTCAIEDGRKRLQSEVIGDMLVGHWRL